MVYPTHDFGRAVGEIVRSVSETCGVREIRIRLTADELTTEIDTADHRKQGKPKKASGDRNWKKAEICKDTPIECDGKTMTAGEWAKKFGISMQSIRNRMRAHGNPYGRKGPTNGDKLLVGAKK